MIKFPKNKVLIIIFVLFFEIVQSSEENKIIIKVNQKIITSYEIKNKINTEIILRNLDMSQTNIDKMKNFAVKNLIDFRIKEKEIEKYDMNKFKEIDISQRLKSLSSGNLNLFKKRFSDYNLNYDIFIKELKIQAAWQKLIFMIYKDAVKINEDELSSEINYLKNQKSNIKEYNLSEIEISFDNNAEKDEKIKKITNSINEVGFLNTVSLFSESISAINNGELGFINEGSLSKVIYENLKNKNEGEISEPIVKLNKIIFLKVNKIRITSNNNLDIEKLKENVINSKKNNLLNLYSKSHLSKLKNNSYIEFK
tara:strand:- start:536 stop:1468 length:933 start_codon:yes stop_codon:yes gene_type:complete